MKKTGIHPAQVRRVGIHLLGDRIRTGLQFLNISLHRLINSKYAGRGNSRIDRLLFSAADIGKVM